MGKQSIEKLGVEMLDVGVPRDVAHLTGSGALAPVMTQVTLTESIGSFLSLDLLGDL